MGGEKNYETSSKNGSRAGKQGRKEERESHNFRGAGATAT